MSNANDAMRWFAETGWPKILKACEGYDIEPPSVDNPDGWWRLVFHLMVEHEPGFDPCPGSPGAPKKPETLVKDAIIVIEFLKAFEAGKSAHAAAKELSKKTRFNDMTPGSIRTRFYELRDPKKPHAQRLRDFLVRALQEEEN